MSNVFFVVEPSKVLLAENYNQSTVNLDAHW